MDVTLWNTDGRYPLKDKHFTKKFFVKLFTEKSIYITKPVSSTLN